MSLARASRFAWMKILALAEPPAVLSQFDVPVVMANVWLPDVPLVVAAKIWTMPGLLPKRIEPRPQPAVPYLAPVCGVAAAAAAFCAPVSSANAWVEARTRP